MAQRVILRLGDPRLRRACQPVAPDELASEGLAALVSDLIDTMRGASGAGIAAPQIGVSKQVCVIEIKHNPRYPTFPEIPLRVLVNPRLTPLAVASELSAQDTISIYEGCLSVPGLRGRVTRPRRVRLQALTGEGVAIDEVWEGAGAAVIQHEVDHLNGTLFVDRADPLTLCFTDEYERYVPVDARVMDGADPTTAQPQPQVALSTEN